MTTGTAPRTGVRARWVSFILLPLAGALGAPATAQWVEGDAETLVTVIGTEGGDLFGRQIAVMGDADGDGISDFAVSSPFHGGFSGGKVSAHSGTDGSTLWVRTLSVTSAILGYSLATMEDADGDGIREVVAGAPWNAGVPGGRLFVFSGADGTDLQVFTGPAEFDTLGHSVATGGDFDGDGTPDLVFSAIGDDTAASEAGRVFVHSTDGFDLICTIEPPPFLTTFQFGTGISFMGDVTGDGRDDLVIGGRLDDFGGTGRLHVYSYDGAAPVFQYSIGPLDFGPPLEEHDDNLDGGRDYDGDAVPDVYFGEDVLERFSLFSGVDGALLYTVTNEGPPASFGTGRMVEDLSGDGHPDILCSATSNDAGAQNGGRVMLFSGSDGAFLRGITHTVEDTFCGAGVTTIPDVDGDGVTDLLAGAPGASLFGNLGRVYVIAGLRPGDVDRDGTVGRLDVEAMLDQWGPCDDCDDCPADFTGDCAVGIRDLLILLGHWGPR